MTDICAANDLVGRRSGFLFWGVPVLVVLAGACAGPALRSVLWTPAFLIMGGACVYNARHCGRLHCFVTGPLYLAAAVASAAAGIGGGPASLWAAIGVGAVLGTVLAYVPEWIRGGYVTAGSQSCPDRSGAPGA